jgi:hypothetical protein
LREQREKRQSQSRRIQGNRGRRDNPRVGELRKQGVERHNPRVGELRKQRVERQSQSRRIEGREGGETITE